MPRPTIQYNISIAPTQSGDALLGTEDLGSALWVYIMTSGYATMVHGRGAIRIALRQLLQNRK